MVLWSDCLICQVVGPVLGSRKNPTGWTGECCRADKFKISNGTLPEGWFSNAGPLLYFHTPGKFIIYRHDCIQINVAFHLLDRYLSLGHDDFMHYLIKYVSFIDIQVLGHAESIFYCRLCLLWSIWWRKKLHYWL